MHKYTLILIIFSVSFYFNHCSSSDSEGEETVTISLDGALQDVELPAGVETQTVFTYQIPPLDSSEGVIDSVSIDIDSTLSKLNVSPGTGSLTTLQKITKYLDVMDASAVMTVRVGGNTETVCSNGVPYGPFQVNSDASGVEITNEESIDATNSTIEVINQGQVTMCLIVTPNIDLTFSLDEIDATIERGECGDPSDFSGTWSGTYTCTEDESDTPFGGSITLTVTQDENNASYTDDNGDTYTGQVCGDVFRFDRDNEFSDIETERGTLTLDSSTTATKRSTYRVINGEESGNCIDDLTRN